MVIIKNAICLSLLAVIFYPVFIFAEETAKITPEDSIVMVISNPPMGKRCGNGFVIGDGTLVVTAHHLIYEKSEKGEHRMPGLLRIFSPYLGDECEGEIFAHDEKLDFAIVKIPWLSHPALKIIDNNNIILLEEVEIIGIPAVIRNLTSDINEPFEEELNFQYEHLPIDFVAIRQQVPRFISLSGVGKLGNGWSGSPMFLPGTAEVVGCFVQVKGTKGQETISAQGPAITQVKSFTEKAGYTTSLRSAEKFLSRTSDGFDIFLLAIDAYRHQLRNEYNLAYEKAQKLIEVRPESIFAYSLAASILEEQNKLEQAEQYYQKAIKLNPEAITPKIYYAQFLSERYPDKAMEILQQIWQKDKYKSYGAMLMNNILSERSEHNRNNKTLKEAVKLDPNNAYLWIGLGACQFHMGDTEEAVISMTKAVELFPEMGPFRGQLARIMEQTGKLDGAEMHFRELLKIEPDNPVVHFWLAQFLAKHRPEAIEEALKEAKNARSLPARGRIPPQIIEQLITELQSHIEQESLE